MLARWAAESIARHSRVLLKEEGGSLKCDILCECCGVCAHMLGHLCMGNMFFFFLFF